MRTEVNNNIREIVADKGKLIGRKGTEVYFSRSIMLPEDTESDYEEVLESEIQEGNENK